MVNTVLCSDKGKSTTGRQEILTHNESQSVGYDGLEY